MKICVTGGGGFIGLELVNRLSELGHEIVIIEDVINCHNFTQIDAKHTVYDWQELINSDNDSFLDGVEFSYHLGANSSTRATAEEVLNPNILFSKWFIRKNISKQIPVVFASSGAVFGSRRIDDNHAPQTEYGKSKSVIENYIHDLPLGSCIALRYHNVYGATESHKGNMASIVSKWVDKYMAGNKEPNELFNGSGNILRDFIHVDDVTKVNLMMLDFYMEYKQLPDSYVIDVGTGQPVSFMAVANEILKHTKGSVQYIINPYDETNYQFYTKAETKDLFDTHRWLYGFEFKPTGIEQGVYNVFCKKTLKNGIHD